MVKASKPRRMAQHTPVNGKMINNTGTAHTLMRKVTSMKAHGSRAKLTVRVSLLTLKTAPPTMETGRTTSITVMVSKETTMNQNTKDNSTRARNTALVLTLGKRAAATQEHGSSIRCTAKVNTPTLTAESTKANGSTAK